MEASVSIGVHINHCCVLHGCKYGDENCPVVGRQVEQEYLCEQCGEELENPILETNEIESELYWLKTRLSKLQLKIIRDIKNNQYSIGKEKELFEQMDWIIP